MSVQVSLLAVTKTSLNTKLALSAFSHDPRFYPSRKNYLSYFGNQRAAVLRMIEMFLTS